MLIAVVVCAHVHGDAAPAPDFDAIAAAATDQVAAQHVPGAVILIGRGDDVPFRRAFGWRRTGAMPEAMTTDVLFDLASLTKVVATTTATMQMVERGRLSLDVPVARYWPAFAAHGKRGITVRDLLTHRSGLRPDLDLRRRWRGYAAAMRLLANDTPVAAPGTSYIYSDENFAVLGELVRRVSGVSLDAYCERNIFGPLQMTHTRFHPSNTADAVAPTDAGGSTGRIVVNDPMAARMGGVAGHAGLFSTADDLARFARMLLHGGALDGTRVLKPESVAAMTMVQGPAASRLRGLGWDLGPAQASAAGDRYPPSSYGHTGYTGTLLWVDPASRTYVIVLTNRTYRGARGDAQPLRDAVLRLAFAARAQ